MHTEHRRAAGEPREGQDDNQTCRWLRHLQARAASASDLVSKTSDAVRPVRSPGGEDYFNDKVLEDTDLLYTGVRRLPADFWDTHGKDMESWKKEGHTYYRVRGPLVPHLHLNEFVYDESGDRPLFALVKEKSGRVAVLETLRDYTHAKNSVWGVTARNREQNFALNLLMNPAVDFITLTGQAGTGKTLLTLAAGSPRSRRDALHRDHRDPRDRAAGRGHRLPARHRGKR